ncbi:MAG: hypothetical protein JXA10_06015 [Anaerolineae bacterium]|nr:hypothetical protein [Anaerolineae bacterium]
MLVERPVAQFESTIWFEQSVAQAQQVLAQFDPISLAEMENVALLNRIDTKYVMRASQLQYALAHIADHFVDA